MGMQARSFLKWKKDYAGDYLLTIKGVSGDTVQKITLSENGQSPSLDARYLLPDYTFEFSLEKPFYKNKIIQQRVQPGINILEFGELEPDLASALFNPKEFWQLLPFSN